jgi:hypothetical protein
MAANRFTLENNCNLRDAYTNQLFNQPSLTERVQQQMEDDRQLELQQERVDEDDMLVDPPPFDPFFEHDANGDDDSRDDVDTLPVKFLNKTQ